MHRIFACHKGKIEQLTSLWNGITYYYPLFNTAHKLVIAFTGAGGKTTWVYELAKELCRQGKRVLIMTTTHMYEPPSEVMASNEAEINRLMKTGKFAVAGIRTGHGKISYGGDELFRSGYALADIVLVEADGSRRMPLKWFGQEEPVLPLQTNCIIHVTGLSALGMPLYQACFRWEESGFEGGKRITAPIVSASVKSCLLKLQQLADVPIIPVLNQMDHAAYLQEGMAIFQSLGGGGLMTHFGKEERGDRQ